MDGGTERPTTFITLLQFSFGHQSNLTYLSKSRKFGWLSKSIYNSGYGGGGVGNVGGSGS